MTSYFFLHYGPGGHAQIEKQWPDFPVNVELWDQPESLTYSDLVDKSLQKIRSSSSSSSSSSSDGYRLVAHSFGCNLAMSLVPLIKIKELILVSPIPSLPTAFKNFGHKILQKTNLEEGYRQSLSQKCENLKVQNADSFWELVHAVAGFELFQDMYWSQLKAYDLYKNLIGQCRPFNFEVWQRVLSDFLISAPEQKLSGVQNVKIILGANDPYIHLETDTSYWLKQASGCQIEVVESGHFPHLETQILHQIFSKNPS